MHYTVYYWQFLRRNKPNTPLFSLLMTELSKTTVSLCAARGTASLTSSSDHICTVHTVNAIYRVFAIIHTMTSDAQFLIESHRIVQQVRSETRCSQHGRHCMLIGDEYRTCLSHTVAVVHIWIHTHTVHVEPKVTPLHNSRIKIIMPNWIMYDLYQAQALHHQQASGVLHDPAAGEFLQGSLLPLVCG